MPFIALGIILIGLAVYFLRFAKKHKDKFMETGMLLIFLSAIFLILIYGLLTLAIKK